jgi:hypothetical protein
VTEGRRGASGDHERRTEALVVNDRVEEIYGQGEVSHRLASGEAVTAPSAPAVPTLVQRLLGAAGEQANRSVSGEVSKPWW